MALPHELLSLDTIRRELRIPDGDNSQDDLIAAQAEAALHEIQSRSGVALLDSTVTITNAVDPASGGAIYLRLHASSPRRVEGVRWITDAGRIIAVDLAGAFEPRIDRVSVDRFGVGTYQLSAEDGQWPQWPDEGATTVAVDLLSGVEAASAPKALVQAAVLLMRQAYNGLADPKADMAANRILAPFVA